MQVVHEGVLYLGRKTTSNSSKDWKKYLFVLKHHQDTKRSFLDYYNDSRKSWQKLEKKGSIDIISYCHVSLAHSCSYMFPLKITTGKDGEVFLAASSFESMNTWYNCLQMHFYLVSSSQDYHEFSVMSQKSYSTDLIGASGECILAFTAQKQLVCALHNSRQVVGVWPYASLRNYWGGRNKFGFKAGRRAPRGEGEFNFTTKQGEEMFKMLERLIKVVSKKPSLQAESIQEENVAQHTDVKAIASPTSILPKLRKRMSTPGPLPRVPVQSVSPLSHTNSCTALPSTSAQVINANTIVSDTSPAYFTSHCAPGVGNLQKGVSRTPSSLSASSSSTVPHEQLHLMSETLPSSFPSSFPPTRETSNQEDTYSHTAHNLPVQFVRNSSMKIIMGDSIYHGLVQADNQGSKSIRSSSKKTATINSSDSTVLYDVAYQPSFQQPKVLVPVTEGDYGSIGDAKEQQREIKEKNLVKNIDNISESLIGETKPLHPGVESVDDGNGGGREEAASGSGDGSDGRNRCTTKVMTKNPTYGSMDNIFSTDMGASLSREKERTASASSVGNKRGVIEDYRVDQMMNEMVLNPVYCDHHLPNLRTKPAPKNNTPEVGYGVTGEHTMPSKVQQFKEEEPVCLVVKNSMVDNPVYGSRMDLPIVNTKIVEVDSHGADSCRPKASGPSIGQDHINADHVCVNQEFLPNSNKEVATTHTTTCTDHVTQNPAPNSMESTMEVGNSCNHIHTGNIDSQHKIILGYSKVNKNSPKEDSPPPPLPPRNYMT